MAAAVHPEVSGLGLLAQQARRPGAQDAQRHRKGPPPGVAATLHRARSSQLYPLNVVEGEEVVGAEGEGHYHLRGGPGGAVAKDARAAGKAGARWQGAHHSFSAQHRPGCMPAHL